MNDQEIRDFNKKYQSTSIFINHNGVKRYCYCEGVMNDGNVTVLKGHFITKRTQEKNDYQIEYVPESDFYVLNNPDSGVFDHMGLSFVYYQKPERQWSKGVSKNNSYIVSPVASFIENIIQPDENFHFRLSRNDQYSVSAVSALFNHTHESLKEAFSALEKQEVVSKSVSQNFFVSIGIEKDEYILWRREYQVATINTTKKAVTLLLPIYLQEIADLFRDNGESYAIS